MKGEGGVNWEGGTDIYTQPCAKQLLETAIEHRELSSVEKNIKDKKRDERGRDRDPSREGSLKKEKFTNTGKHSHWRALAPQRAT